MALPEYFHEMRPEVRIMEVKDQSSIRIREECLDDGVKRILGKYPGIDAESLKNQISKQVDALISLNTLPDKEHVPFVSGRIDKDTDPVNYEARLLGLRLTEGYLRCVHLDDRTKPITHQILKFVYGDLIK